MALLKPQSVFAIRKKPILAKRMRKSRLEFFNKYKNKPVEFWRKVIFSDETYIEVSLDSVMNRAV